MAKIFNIRREESRRTRPNFSEEALALRFAERHTAERATSLRGINGSASMESNGRSMKRARRGRSLASSAAKLQVE
jgi:hypothetical protein